MKLFAFLKRIFPDPVKTRRVHCRFCGGDFDFRFDDIPPQNHCCWDCLERMAGNQPPPPKRQNLSPDETLKRLFGK